MTSCMHALHECIYVCMYMYIYIYIYITRVYIYISCIHTLRAYMYHACDNNLAVSTSMHVRGVVNTTLTLGSAQARTLQELIPALDSLHAQVFASFGYDPAREIRVN